MVEVGSLFQLLVFAASLQCLSFRISDAPPLVKIQEHILHLVYIRGIIPEYFASPNSREVARKFSPIHTRAEQHFSTQTHPQQIQYHALHPLPFSPQSCEAPPQQEDDYYILQRQRPPYDVHQQVETTDRVHWQASLHLDCSMQGFVKNY